MKNPGVRVSGVWCRRLCDRGFPRRSDCSTFSHPDCTDGSGFSPDRLLGL